jgi:hypothetical protein
MFRTVRSAALALACVAGVFAPTAASAEQVEAEHYVDDFSNEVPAHDPDYCPDLDFAVVDAGHSEGFFHGVRRGDGLVYFSDHFTFEGTVTNLSNGKTLHVTAHASSMDVHVVDNGDGTLTITWRFVGTVVNEFPTVTFRDSGQIMGQDLIDNAGTPGDPDDDEFIDFLGILKEVGHHDTSDRDYCADLAEFLG